MIGFFLKRYAAEIIILLIGLCLIFGAFIYASTPMFCLGLALWLTLLLLAWLGKLTS